MQITDTIKTSDSAESMNSRLPKNQMGKDEFMQILVAQLRNQDPLSPMEDKDFIAQIAQFSTLEQMQSMNEGATFAQAASLVGKHVYSVITNMDGQRQEINGVVKSVMTIGKIPHLEVDGYLIPYSTDLVISDGESLQENTITDEAEAINGSEEISESEEI